MPPKILGCSVFTRPSIISGKAGVVGHVADLEALLAQELSRAAGAEDLDARRGQAAGQLGQARLSLTLMSARRMGMRSMHAPSWKWTCKANLGLRLPAASGQGLRNRATHSACR